MGIELSPSRLAGAARVKPGPEAPSKPRQRRKYVYRPMSDVPITPARPHPIPSRDEIARLVEKAGRDGTPIVQPVQVPDSLQQQMEAEYSVFGKSGGKPEPGIPGVPIAPPATAAISVEGMIAANRFGMGARPGDLEAASADPQGWLNAQLDQPEKVVAEGMLATRECMMFQGDFEYTPETYHLYEQAVQRLLHTGQKLTTPGIPKFENVWNDFYRGRVSDMEVRYRDFMSIQSDVPFLERLVRFWSNHFSVSFNDNTMDICGAFERDVARRHLMGKFSRLLVASTLHPTMLIFLNNVDSVGGNSPAGGGTTRANENLAREVLELHSMGVDGGYTQDDVFELANALTGSVVGRGWMGPESAGRYHYLWWIHEPGSRHVLGKWYREENDTPLQAIRILNDIARHPSTIRYVCTKLARHFVSDEPPASLINHLVRVWEQRDGELYYVYKALVNHPASWDPERAKLKTPNEVLVSAGRAIGAQAVYGEGQPYDEWLTILLYEDLGQYPFRAPSPEGWDDISESWNSPASMMVRMQWANVAGARTGVSLRPHVFLRNAVGRNISQNTRFWTDGAASPDQGIALALMAPEFQAR